MPVAGLAVARGRQRREVRLDARGGVELLDFIIYSLGGKGWVEGVVREGAWSWQVRRGP
jgi:hypothetical protein